MQTVTRGWPPARRKKQAEIIRKTKSWLKTIGPKTAAGKAASSKNAYKHGLRSGVWLALRRALAAYRRFLKFIDCALAHIKQRPQIDIEYMHHHLNYEKYLAIRAKLLYQ